MFDDAREDFMRGYVEAMLWANTLIEREGEDESEWEDVRYWYQSPGRWWQDTPVDITDADTFWDSLGYVIAAVPYYREHGIDYAGHDFALTRNHHGAGFWDRGLGRIGDMLTVEAHAYGENNVIIVVDENDEVISTCNTN